MTKCWAKAFGYDLFEGVPSTFAPVKDIQVPIDYVDHRSGRYDAYSTVWKRHRFLHANCRTGRSHRFSEAGPHSGERHGI